MKNGPILRVINDSPKTGFIYTDVRRYDTDLHSQMHRDNNDTNLPFSTGTRDIKTDKEI
jgi:hypothetical protein